MGYTPPQLELRRTSGVWTAYAPSSTSTDDIIIRPNTVDTSGFLRINGNGQVFIVCNSGTSIELAYDAVPTSFMKFYYGATAESIMSLINNADLALLTTGSGVLKFGEYSAGAATDSTGYITIKDAAGNTRKLMVQA